jgi:superfamily II DNA or RNA helicase
MVKEGVKVLGIKKIDTPDVVYNLHIDGNHNYFANGINVSNCHLYKATSLISIMEKCSNVPWRIGTTGTIANKDSKVNVLTLEGLFGPVYKVSTTKELMDANHLSQFKIKAIVLKHKKEDSIAVRKLNYQGELDFFVSHKKRNRFIAKLALSQKRNTLILFQFVEKHGKVLYDIINEMNDGTKTIHYVSGEISGEEREKVRAMCEKSDNNIIVASYGVFSTGTNIKNLHNIIFAMGFKSRIKNLQSIGRGLRLNDDKEFAVLYDIVDDCSVKSKQNFSVKHFIERVQIYNEEKFDFKIHTITL